MPKKVQRTSSRSARSKRQPTKDASQASLTVKWNRVYEKTKTDLKRLREYGLPAETTAFRIVQCNREKATLYGDYDHLEHKDSGDLTSLVRDIIEGRPPKDYSPTRPILTSPSRFFLHTRGKLKKVVMKEVKGRLTADEIGDRMTIIDANAPLSEEAIEALARLLIDIDERRKEKAREE